MSFINDSKFHVRWQNIITCLRMTISVIYDLPDFEDVSAVENPPFVLDATFCMLGSCELVDKLGNTLETKPELKLCAFNSVASKTNTTTKLFHNNSIWNLVSLVNSHITVDFLSPSSRLVVQLFVHLEIKYDRCFSDCFATAISIIP